MTPSRSLVTTAGKADSVVHVFPHTWKNKNLGIQPKSFVRVAQARLNQHPTGDPRKKSIVR